MSSPDELSDQPVRRYVLTEGRAAPVHGDLRPETLLIAVDQAELPVTATREDRLLVRMCHGLLSLTEVAAHLHLPVSVVTVVASKLIASGHLSVHTRGTGATGPSMKDLEELLNGLRCL